MDLLKRANSHINSPVPPTVDSSYSMNLDVVVIDDDAIILFLHKVLIKKSKLPSRVKDFLNAKEALDYLIERDSLGYVLIFLDINMPECNGWDFLEKIKFLPDSDKILIVMVTSSMNSSDRQRAAKYSSIIDYHEKPLSKQACEEIYYKVLNIINS